MIRFSLLRPCARAFVRPARRCVPASAAGSAPLVGRGQGFRHRGGFKRVGQAGKVAGFGGGICSVPARRPRSRTPVPRAAAQAPPRVFFLRKEEVVLNHKRTVQPHPFIEKTLKKLKITTVTPTFRVFTSSFLIPAATVRRNQAYSCHLHQRRSPRGGDRRGGLTAKRRS